MAAQRIDGTAVARRVREDVAKGVEKLVAAGGTAPGLATVLIGDDPASEVYVRNKRKLSAAAGMQDLHRHLPGDVDQDTAAALIDELAADPAVSGILLQLPTPKHLDSDALIARIPAEKDVDGLTTLNAGLLMQGRPGLRPCTPASSSSSITPVGVHGRSPSRPSASSPALTGVSPSTSLPGSMRLVSSTPSRWSGTGSWQRIPLTSGSALSCWMRSTTCSRVASAARRWSKPRMPTSAVALCLLAT